MKATYPKPVVLDLVRAKVITRKRFVGFDVYVLTGVGLRPYGYSMRYNYVPAKSVVLGALILRTVARQYEQEGYKVTLYDGYAKRGRDNLLLVRKYHKVTLVIGRASLTLRAVRQIVTSLQKDLPKIAEIHAVVLEGNHDPLLVNARSMNAIPFKLAQLPLLRVIGKESGEEVEQV
ncbi:hypothetical protein [Deinococcus saxicola]|uniref:hypothetical protein n=1 Tax=Deinococcus saxicola TaxID=249406 RepID=UPI0039EE017A